MRLRSIEIGNLKTANNVFLAPLAGYANAVFRKMCSRFGASVTFTEMVSAKGLIYGDEKTKELLLVQEGTEGIVGCQIFGKEPDVMREAACGEALAPFPLLDINMGCPVPKIYKNGEGSALMQDFSLASKIISECKKSGKAVSVKFRIGLSESDIKCVEFAKMCEDSGADMITVHGRTRDAMYSGDVHFDEIAKAKAAVKIPVIANGGVFSKEDADRLMDETGADGVAVARGAMYSPWIIAEIAGRECPDKRETVLCQLRDMRALYGDRFSLVYMRKMAAFYLRGRPYGASARARFMAAASCEELRGLIEETEF